MSSSPLPPETPDAAQRKPAEPSQWAILVILGVVMTTGGTELTKVSVALPAVANALALSDLQVLWTADLYALAAGVMVVPAAVLADRYGRKRMYFLGLSVAVISAAVAGAAHAPEVLLIARAGQGVGLAMLIAATVAIIRVTFVGLSRRALAYGVWAAGFSVGTAVGPLLGGALTDGVGWRWVFWINVAVLLICLVAADLVLRESTSDDPPSIDPLSVLTAAAAVGLIIVGLKGLAQPEGSGLMSAAAVLAGACSAALFVRRQLRMPRPFLDVRLFTNPLLAVCAAIIAATNGLFNGVLYLLTQQLQIIDGHSAIGAGIALLPLAVACAVGAVIGPVLQHRLVLQHVIVIGLILAGTGVVTLTTSVPRPTGMILLGIGAGIIMAIAANALMSAARPNRVADAGAIQESSFVIGGGTGIATLGALSIFAGSQSARRTSTADIFGPGADAALSIAGYGYAGLALVAAFLILRTGPEHVHEGRDTR